MAQGSVEGFTRLSLSLCDNKVAPKTRLDQARDPDLGERLRKKEACWPSGVCVSAPGCAVGRSAPKP